MRARRVPPGAGERSDEAVWIADLQERLVEASRPETREWWTRYLKGSASFRGVPMAGVRRAVHGWAAAHGIEPDLSDARLLDLTDGLFRQPYTEDKLAAMVFIQETLLPAGRLSWRLALERWAMLFRDGALGDWNACDWFCVKVLGPLIRREDELCARAVAAWIDADGLWQRRASTVAFVNLVALEDELFPGMRELVLDNCRALVGREQRFAQTAAGWVLCELSKAAPAAVTTFIGEERQRISPEALRKATKHLATRP